MSTTNQLVVRQSLDSTALVEAFKRGRSRNTLAAYAASLDLFARFTGHAGSPVAAVSDLLSREHGEANLLMHESRSSLIESGLAPATVNGHLYALRSLAKFARMMGHSTWRPEVESVRSQKLRDTAGPGLDGVKALLEAAGRAPDRRKAARDAALIRMMFDLGLRRGGLASLDVEHVDLVRGRVMILGKGRSERSPMAMPDETVSALKTWLQERETVCKPADAPLFVSLLGPTAFQRLTGNGIQWIIIELGKAAGIKARPHGLRHASITAYLDLSNGDLRGAQRHARHASANTTLKYDDNRSDMAGVAAKKVAGLV